MSEHVEIFIWVAIHGPRYFSEVMHGPDGIGNQNADIGELEK